MCGIFGYFDRRGDSLSNDQIEAMAAALRHRGPDDHGVFQEPGVALGNTRLSIIDVAGGHQPVVSADGQVVVVQNGEIYNYRELTADLAARGVTFQTKCDTEVILHLYELLGSAFVSQLNGMFAIAIYDRRKQELLLARDRLGVKPLYIGDSGHRLFFASEIKALLAAGVRQSISHEALSQYLSFQYVPPPRTIFSDVFHLEPGTLLSISSNGSRQTRWWDLREVSQKNWKEGEAITECEDLIRDSVRIRCRADVPFGAFLSSGVDSSTVVATMARELDAPVDAFTIGVGDPKSSEVSLAEEVARACGVRHHVHWSGAELLDLWPRCVFACDQPHGDASFLPTFALSQFASQRVKVVLTGDGADELFGGYDRHLRMLQRSSATPERAYFEESTLFSIEDGQSILPSHDEGQLRVQCSEYANECGHWDELTRLLYLDCKLLLPGNNLVKPDRMGMACSLEARDPYLDHRLVEFAFSLPAELKIRGGTTKYVLKEIAARSLDRNFFERPKRMFGVPLHEWMTTRLRPLFVDTLSSERFLDRGLFRADGVRLLVQDFETDPQRWLRQVRSLFVFELWCRTFMEDAEKGSDPFSASPISLGCDNFVRRVLKLGDRILCGSRRGNQRS